MRTVHDSGPIEDIIKALEIYDLEQPLGTGGMGTVHLLKNRLTGRQYASKVCILPDRADHRLFLEELRVWIDLPVHPHLAACYFFRTVQDRVVIFAEYLAGGSIADGLRRADLNATEQILDVAIQSARGLAALHEFGFVHGDVKPGNILLTRDGQVKVADFGLAFSRRRIPGLRRGSELYRSPEQFSETVTAASDVWSWGLTVLEMFTREPRWSDGNAAPSALREYLRQGGKMPVKLAAVLKRCFEWKPERRWASMREIEADLLGVFQEVTRRDYAYEAPFLPSSFSSGEEPVRLHYTTWPAPQTWLDWIQEQSAGSGETASEELPLPESRTGQVLSDLIAYDDVLSALRALVARRPELRQKIPRVHLCRGFIYERLHDYAAASQAFEQVMTTYDEALTESQEERVELLGLAMTHRASVLNRLSRWNEALEVLHQAGELYASAHDVHGLSEVITTEAIARSEGGEGELAIEAAIRALQTAYENAKEGWRDVAAVALALSNLGSVAQRWGQRERAAEALASATENFEKLLTVGWTEADVERLAVEHPELERTTIRAALSIDRPHLQSILSDWAQVAAHYTSLLAETGRADEAADFARRGIQRLEELEPWLRAAFSERIAGFYFGLGEAELFAGRHNESVMACGKAADLYNDLVGRQGRDDLGADLGVVYANWSTAMIRGGDLGGGTKILDRAAELFEAYHRARPGQKTAHNWARIVVNRGIAEYHRKDWRAAREFFDQALRIYASVRGESASIFGDVAWARASRGYASLLLGDVHEGIEDLHVSVPVIQSEAKRTGRAELVSLTERFEKLWGDREWGFAEAEVPPLSRNEEGGSGKWWKGWFGR
jgi:serine/threonine protein kinase